MSGASFGGEAIEATGARYGIFEMAFPYMYIPMSDFNRLADIINAKVGKTPCIKNTGKCYFEESCDQLHVDGTLSVSFIDNNN